MKRTPSQPPKRARAKMRVDSRSKPRKMRAGRVKMTPEAMDWPALPVVWTMLFSRIEALPKARRMEMDQNGDRDGGGDGETGAQADVDRDGAEEDAEDRAEEEGAGAELWAGLGGGDEGLEAGLVAVAMGVRLLRAGDLEGRDG